MEFHDLLLVSDKWIIAFYPFILFGSAAACAICFKAYIFTKDKAFVLNWLLLGIILNMIGLFLESSLFFGGRITGNLDYANNVFILPISKFLFSFGCWFHFFGALAALRGLSQKYIKSSLVWGTAIFAVLYSAAVIWM